MARFLSALFVLIAISSLQADGKQFSRCEIVRELRKHGFPQDKLRDWVCLVEAESSGNPNKVSPVNRDGSRDYGLFQINDRYWCSNTNTPGKDCHVKCSDVATTDITLASQCAKKIYNRHKFRAWNGWKDKCQGALPNISSC